MPPNLPERPERAARRRLTVREGKVSPSLDGSELEGYLQWSFWHKRQTNALYNDKLREAWHGMKKGDRIRKHFMKLGDMTRKERDSGGAAEKSSIVSSGKKSTGGPKPPARVPPKGPVGPGKSSNRSSNRPPLPPPNNAPSTPPPPPADDSEAATSDSEWEFVTKELRGKNIGPINGEWRRARWIGSERIEKGAPREFQRWVCGDDTSGIVERLLVKKTPVTDSPAGVGAWIQGRLSALGCSNILRQRGFSMRPASKKRKRRQLSYGYLDDPPFGNLETLMQNYRNEGRIIPEPFLWVVFRALVEGITAMTGEYQENNRAAEKSDKDIQIIHLDLKPENVMIGNHPLRNFATYPTPLIANFDHAANIRGGLSDKQGQELRRTGTYGWRAPEMKPRGREHPDNGSEPGPNDPNAVESRAITRSPEEDNTREDSDPGRWPLTNGADIFNAGLIMLSLMRYNLSDPRELCPKVYTSRISLPLPDPPEWTPLYGEDLHLLVDRCLQWDPADRINLPELRKEIQRAIRRSIAYLHVDFERDQELWYPSYGVIEQDVETEWVEGHAMPPRKRRKVRTQEVLRAQRDFTAAEKAEVQQIIEGGLSDVEFQGTLSEGGEVVAAPGGNVHRRVVGLWRGTSVDKLPIWIAVKRIDFSHESENVRRRLRQAADDEISLHSEVEGTAHILEILSNKQPSEGQDDPNAFYLCTKYIQYGTLRDLIARHKAVKRAIPEPFCWWMFKALALAVQMMMTGREQEPTPSESDSSASRSSQAVAGSSASEKRLASAEEEQGDDDEDEDEWKPIVHLDIHPGNVFLNDRTTGLRRFPSYPIPVLGDFGYACQLGQLQKGFRSNGRPSWRAPEQYDDNDTQECVKVQVLPSEKTDIFNIGLVIWTMIRSQAESDELLFQAREALRETNENAHRPLEIPRSGGLYSRYLNELVRACLAQDPDDRPDHGELLEAIDEKIERVRRRYRQDFTREVDLPAGFQILLENPPKPHFLDSNRFEGDDDDDGPPSGAGDKKSVYDLPRVPKRPNAPKGDPSKGAPKGGPAPGGGKDKRVLIDGRLYKNKDEAPQAGQGGRRLGDRNQGNNQAAGAVSSVPPQTGRGIGHSLGGALGGLSGRPHPPAGRDAPSAGGHSSHRPSPPPPPKPAESRKGKTSSQRKRGPQVEDQSGRAGQAPIDQSAFTEAQIAEILHNIQEAEARRTTQAPNSPPLEPLQEDEFVDNPEEFDLDVDEPAATPAPGGRAIGKGKAKGVGENVPREKIRLPELGRGFQTVAAKRARAVEAKARAEKEAAERRKGGKG